MATTSASVAETPAHPETPQTTQETQETQQKQTPFDAKSVAMKSSADGVSSRTSRPRAAAAAANAEMVKQVKGEETPLSVVFAKAASDAAASKPPQQRAPADHAAKTQDVAMLPDDADDVAIMKEEQPPAEEGRRRPSRAAAAAANAGMARQGKEEEGSLGMLLASAQVRPMEQEQEVVESKPTRPRVAATTAGSTKVAQDTLELTSAEQQPQRGKKRRQAPVFEAAPIITDLPPLPFTTPSAELKLKNKSKSKNKHAAATTKTKAKQSVEEAAGDDARHCEFCRKAANVCVLMHCHACRRVYHAKCFWHAFKPYVDAKVSILDQLKRLQLEAPERRGNIFRCASCRAAFRKLVQMMNDMELEKQRKKDQKDKTKKSGAAKPPTSTPSRSNSTSRSQRTRRGSAALDDGVLNARTTKPSTSRSVPPEGLDVKKEGDNNAEGRDVKKGEDTNAGPVDGVNGKKDAVKAGSEAKAVPMDVDAGADTQPGSGEPGSAEKTTHGPEMEQHVSTVAERQQESHPAEAATQHQETKTQPELQQLAQYAAAAKKEQAELQANQELVPAKAGRTVREVRVHHETKTERWCFPIVCSRTTSLRVSGMMKLGTCKWPLKKRAVIQCACCDKLFGYPEFVHHTDSSLVKDAKCATEDPMPYLFVEHRDTTLHTPLDDFLPALRSWAGRQSANNPPTNSRRGHALRREAAAAVAIPTMNMTNPEAAAEALPATVSRLCALALFKRPKPRSDKTSTAARLSDPPSLDFLALVVCLSPKYVMNMSNGSLVDRVVRSNTSVPDHSFPRKSGWLAFNWTVTLSRQVTCTCCEKSYTFESFVEHAGISLIELKQKSRQVLYVVERTDESALVPYNSFATDLETRPTGWIRSWTSSTRRLHPLDLYNNKKGSCVRV
ncbi:hypothetical protein PHYSODRAFT_335970 [Phytophthora sojae]|uniref:Tify domain-containing protein n=1 Tax=Phytophthora sojae (strain P6497) TaxID=1094619 RepID=G4ZS36_PHYSP|nr:hypothetical protein PHYSODRAFT_335970 [Phytophthora sojae]EGZ14332.1 hypothetical protein PHYSODRAFT_335970 [Phytophthora sojae]|eukprot:XP_009531761.1 hypothetical protein PHYSODRAFT_335970 [Phytophthora sojae]